MRLKSPAKERYVKQTVQAGKIESMTVLASLAINKGNPLMLFFVQDIFQGPLVKADIIDLL